jgi:hypothetical protein
VGIDRCLGDRVKLYGTSNVVGIVTMEDCRHDSSNSGLAASYRIFAHKNGTVYFFITGEYQFPNKDSVP